MVTVLTIGHSNHAPERFLRLLQQHGVARLVDIRSQPFSRRHPHFSRRPLQALLSGAGVEYVFMGDALGGRPDDRASRRPDGSLDIARRRGAEDFQAGVTRLLELAEHASTAMMCAEEDPARCHRRGLVTPELLQRRAMVVHIRGDGRLEAESGGEGQLSLF